MIKKSIYAKLRAIHAKKYSFLLKSNRMATLMKSLSIIIPSYNSEDYLQQCLNSLLIGRDDELDVIVINDGSTDKTSSIAHEYNNKYPFIRVVDKENAGHGSCINLGIKIAQGLYFKVLDSDDSLNKEGLLHLLDVIKLENDAHNNPDLFLADYCSYYEDNNLPQARISFKKYVKEIETVITWDELNKIGLSDFFMMHMTIVKTSLLRKIKIPLLEHTFYEDNQFLFYIIKNTRTLYYLDKELYKYTVGRKGQSISLDNMAKKYEHQYRVMHAIIDHINIEEYKLMDKSLKWHIRHELLKMSVLLFFYTYIAKGKERNKKYQEFYKYFKESNLEIYRIWKYHTPSFVIWLQIPFLKHLTCRIGYKIFAKRKGWK